MATVSLCPVWVGNQFFDANGNPLAGGLIYTCYAGSTTNLAPSYSETTGTVLNTNPIVLDSAGRLTSEIWLEALSTYQLILADSADTVISSLDNIRGTNTGVAQLVASVSEGTFTATAGQTLFTVPLAYVIGANALDVYINGLRLNVSTDYAETSVTSFTLATGAQVGDEVHYVINIYSPAALNLGAQDGSSLVGHIAAGTGAVPTTVQNKLRETVSVKDFGAVGDGVTSDRLAIRAAFDYAVTSTLPVSIVFPNGIYYLGTGYDDISIGVQLILGSKTAVNTNKNIELVGHGATIYQGAPGRAIGVFGADGVNIHGFKFVGYTGGALGSTRENDCLITVNYNSRHVSIHDNYMTNSLGDCIYLGGTLVSGGGTGAGCFDISIQNNVLKNRYGDGVMSFLGGTMGRMAVAIIDAVNVLIQGNKIYGQLDLEPNLNGQYIQSVNITGNEFLAGHVTAQSVIGTTYWYDEPINASGGASFVNAVQCVGSPGAAIINGNSVKNNSFENGLIIFGELYMFEVVENNNFKVGQIRLGYTSGSNYTSNATIRNNTMLSFYPGETTFIRMDGLCSYCAFDNNVVNNFNINAGYCINNNGASTGDNGRNVFTNNKCMGNTQLGVIGFTPAVTSFVAGNIVETGTSFQRVPNGNMSVTSSVSPLASIATTGTNMTINWQSYQSNTWYFSNNTGNDSLSTISNVPPDGFILTIMCGKTAGRTFTINYNSSYFRTKGAVNAVLSDSQHNITFIVRAGIFFEMCRSF